MSSSDLNGSSCKVRESVSQASSEIKRIVNDAAQKREYKGGEGVERLIKNRKPDHVKKKYLRDDDYWLTTLFSLRGRAIPAVPLAIYLLYCSGIAAIVMYAMREDGRDMYAPALTQVQTLLNALMALLMAFRVNQSYNRWWDGRKAWEVVRNSCVILARHAHAYLDDNAVARQLIGYVSIFPRVLKMHLHKSHELRVYRGELSPDEIEDLSLCRHRPMFILGKMSECLAKNITELPRITLLFERHIENLTLATTSTNTVSTTPVPFSYIAHLRTIVIMFLSVLPWIYTITLSWYALIICFAFGFAWFGLETMSVEIESPFGVDYNDLPLDKLNADIHNIISNWPDVAPKYTRQCVYHLTFMAEEAALKLTKDSVPHMDDDDSIAPSRALSSKSGVFSGDSVGDDYLEKVYSGVEVTHTQGRQVDRYLSKKYSAVEVATEEGLLGAKHMGHIGADEAQGGRLLSKKLPSRMFGVPEGTVLTEVEIPAEHPRGFMRGISFGSRKHSNTSNHDRHPSGEHQVGGVLERHISASPRSLRFTCSNNYERFNDAEEMSEVAIDNRLPVTTLMEEDSKV